LKPVEGPSWTIFSTHGLVLFQLARQPDLRLRDIAATIGITERAAQNMVNDLVSGGYLERTRVGRRNRYLVRGDRFLPHPSMRSHSVAEVAAVLASTVRAPESAESCLAVVFACSDHRIQGQLRQLLAVQGLLDRSETVLWPGAPWALDSPSGERILRAVKAVTPPGVQRVLLVAHRGCRAPEAPPREGWPVLRQAISRFRRTITPRVRYTFGLEPEAWFVDGERVRGGARAARSGGEPAAAAP
jgi:hypothetical protein